MIRAPHTAKETAYSRPPHAITEIILNFLVKDVIRGVRIITITALKLPRKP